MNAEQEQEQERVVQHTMLLNNIFQWKVFTIIDIITTIWSFDRHVSTLLLVLQQVVSGHLHLPEVATQCKAQEEALHLVGVRVDLAVSQFFERKDSLGLANEDLGLAFAVLVGLQVEALQNDVDALLDAAVVVGERAVAADAVAVEEVFIKVAIRIASTAHTDVLEQTQVAHLMHHELVVKVVRALAFVWLHATNVVRLAGRQGLDQQSDRFLDLGTGRRWTALVGGLSGFREQLRQERTLGTGTEIDQIVEEQVSILITESFNIVRHLSYKYTIVV
jgi:hypothetical protein